ncbi:unnamed protein product, partial [Polarella glacialis]
MATGRELLSDEQVQRFIVEGYLELPPCGDGITSPGLAFHEGIFNAALALGPEAEARGNNILPELPELVNVFESPQCKGALTSLLGPGYMMHPHRFCHKSEPGRQEQRWHRDTYWGHHHARSHCPYWVMALYYPQNTPLELGPTGILPRSQYFNRDQGRGHEHFGNGSFTSAEVAARRCWDLQARSLACPAGTIILIHYDLWHAGTANVSEDCVRFMFKFQFSRMVSPTKAPCSWICQNRTAHWQRFLEDEAAATPTEASHSGLFHYDVHSSSEGLVPVWQGVWDWMCGAAAVRTDAHTNNNNNSSTNSNNNTNNNNNNDDVHMDLADLVSRLKEGDDANEPRRVASAWQLGRLAAGQAGLIAEVLAELHLDSANACQARAVSQMLVAIGPSALPLLLECPLWRHSPAVVHALGRIVDCCCERSSRFAAQKVLSDYLYAGSNCDDVRNCAAEALGCTEEQAGAWTLLDVLAYDPVTDVRATACHSLLRLLEAGCMDDCLEGVRAAMLAA